MNHKVLTYIEYRAVSGVFRLLTPYPLSTQRVCTPPAPCNGGGGGGTLMQSHSPGSEGVWGLIFWKTPCRNLIGESLYGMNVKFLTTIAWNAACFNVALGSAADIFSAIKSAAVLQVYKRIRENIQSLEMLKSCALPPTSQQSWIQSQHPPTRWNLGDSRWGSS